MVDTPKPAWMDNILACYPYLIAQLRQVPAIRQVLEAQDFAAISSSQRRQLPQDGSVYVLLDGFTPQSTTDNNRAQTMEIGFSVILTKQQVTPQAATGGVGQSITAIAKALQGFDPVDEYGRALTSSAFKQRNALAVQYEEGFAFFPLRFTTTVEVINDEG